MAKSKRQAVANRLMEDLEERHTGDWALTLAANALKARGQMGAAAEVIAISEAITRAKESLPRAPKWNGPCLKQSEPC